MVKRKLKYLITILFFISSFAFANPNVDQWMESDKRYKDLINEGFEVKSYAMNTIETANGLYILLFVTVLQKEKEIILIQQFRAGVLSRYDESYLLEIVAGIVDEGENPEQTAIRECFEETGCEVKKIFPIQSYFPAPGSSESYYHLYLGEIQAFDGERIKGLEKENEDILVKSFKIDEVRQMLKEKKITNGLTLIALQWFFLEHYKG